MKIKESIFSDVGIDSIGFYAPRHYVNLEELARERKIDFLKFKKGLVLREMRIPEVDEDILSIGLKAGYHALMRGDINPKDIDALFVGTETITYAVKSVSNIFAEWLGISVNSLTQDIYNACAAGTLAVLNAIGLIEKGVVNKALVIIADISSYSLGSPGEPTQGSGAVALVLSKNPRVASFNNKFGKISGNINDFFRPANEENAQVFGHFSIDSYTNFQLKAYDDLINKIGEFIADSYVFHAPYAKLPLRCMGNIIEKRWLNNIRKMQEFVIHSNKTRVINNIDPYIVNNIDLIRENFHLKLSERGVSADNIQKLQNLEDNFKKLILPQLKIPIYFGNMYAASVWAQVIYLLENFAHENYTIYFGSYGSGATCISGLLKVNNQFKEIVRRHPNINDTINNKTLMSVQDYISIKNHCITPTILIGQIKEHDKNDNRGFHYYFCDKGCVISNREGLKYCPKGHSGYHSKFFPLHGVLTSEPKSLDLKDLSYLNDNHVRISPKAKKGDILEYEIRRVNIENFEACEAQGLIDWVPSYVPVPDNFKFYPTK